jgi:hypothetical protein
VIAVLYSYFNNLVTYPHTFYECNWVPSQTSTPHKPTNQLVAPPTPQLCSNTRTYCSTINIVGMKTGIKKRDTERDNILNCVTTKKPSTSQVCVKKICRIKTAVLYYRFQYNKAYPIYLLYSIRSSTGLTTKGYRICQYI